MTSKLRAFFQGKKTYIVAIAAVAAALLAFTSGQASLFEMVEAILIATGLGTLRAGVATEAK